MLRSILAVLLGYIPMAAAVQVTLMRAGHNPDNAMVVGFDVARLVYDTIAAVLGGYIVAWVAHRSELLHGTALAIIGVVVGIYFLFISAEPVPAWFEIVDLVLMVVGVMVGAFFRVWQQAQDARQT